VHPETVYVESGGVFWKFSAPEWLDHVEKASKKGKLSLPAGKRLKKRPAEVVPYFNGQWESYLVRTPLLRIVSVGRWDVEDIRYHARVFRALHGAAYKKKVEVAKPVKAAGNARSLPRGRKNPG
jgi:hypothetical protein